MSDKCYIVMCNDCYIIVCDECYLNTIQKKVEGKRVKGWKFRKQENDWERQSGKQVK